VGMLRACRRVILKYLRDDGLWWRLVTRRSGTIPMSLSSSLHYEARYVYLFHMPMYMDRLTPFALFDRPYLRASHIIGESRRRRGKPLNSCLPSSCIFPSLHTTPLPGYADYCRNLSPSTDRLCYGYTMLHERGPCAL
jgi:hypothetical protein